MGFQKADCFAGIEKHTPTSRYPQLSDGDHVVKLVNCICFLSQDKKPTSVIEMKLLDTNNGKDVIGDTYSHLYVVGEFESYYYKGLKQFLGAATGMAYDDITTELVIGLFVDREEANRGEKSPLADLELRLRIRTKKALNRKGEEVDRTSVEFLPPTSVAA